MSESLSSVLGNSPTLRGVALPTYFGFNDPAALPGYASSSGSAIQLPATSTGTVVAKSVTGSTLWSFTIASFSAAITGTITNWVGWYMNDAATELFGLAFDSATTTDTFYTFSIDVTGAITEAGNDKPLTDFTLAPTWNDAGSIQPDGSGGFKIFGGGLVAADDEFAIVDSAGQFTTDPTSVMTNATFPVGKRMHETTGGKLLGPLESDDTNDNSSLTVSNKTDSAELFLPYDAVKGIGVSTNGFIFMRWQDFVINWAAAPIQVEGRFKYTQAQVDQFADELLAYGGTPA